MSNEEESLTIPVKKYDGSEIDNVRVDSENRVITLFLKDGTCFVFRPKLSMDFNKIEAVLDTEKRFWGRIG